MQLVPDATDNTADANTLTLNLTGSNPANGSAFTNLSGGAVVNWPGAAASSWDATSEYSTTSNPNGPWRAGWLTSYGAPLNTFTSNDGQPFNTAELGQRGFGGSQWVQRYALGVGLWRFGA